MATNVNTVHQLGEKEALRYNSKTHRLCPSDCAFTSLTFILILVPSSFCLGYVILFGQVFDIWLRVLLFLINGSTLFLCLYNLCKCTYTEPGILPSLTLNNKLRDQIKLTIKNQQDYYALYQTRDELEVTMQQQGIKADDHVTKFYNIKKFKYQKPELDEERKTLVTGAGNKHNKMSYCSTCKLLRPPRAFHCGTCGVCVEVHDHHCPWVGTCVGYRNSRYFVGFLLTTCLHAICTFVICLTGWLLDAKLDRGDQDIIFQSIAKCVCLFTGVISLTLFGFFCYQFFHLVLSNKASNEEIRARWNGHSKNWDASQIYREDSNCFQKFNHFVYGPMPESRLAKLARLYELNEELIQLRGPINSDESSVGAGNSVVDGSRASRRQLKESDRQPLISQEGRVSALQAEYNALYEELGNFNILRQYGIDIPASDLDDPTVAKKCSERQGSGVVGPARHSQASESQAAEGGGVSLHIEAKQK